MGQFPFAFERINETTWAYLSSFLMIALFFKFNRFWSVRNLDLLLIILLAPGILMVHVGQRWENSIEPTEATASPDDAEGATGQENEPVNAGAVPVEPPTEAPSESQTLTGTDESSNVDSADATPGKTQENQLELARLLQLWGYYWLFSVGALFLIRLLLDNALIRRPILESNLNISGLVFLGCTLMIFLFLNVVNSYPSQEDLSGAQSAVKLLQREAAEENDVDQLIQRGPGYTLISVLPIIPSFGGDEVLEADLSKVDQRENRNINRYVAAAKSLAIASQFAIVLGLILIGYWHFNNFRTGVEAATIYLILPYTAIFMGHAMHGLPAALMVWAIAFLKRPFLAGILIGLAIGVSYYPLFLLALWISFYWEKGKWPFIYGVLISLAICAAGLLFTSASFGQFLSPLQRMLGAFTPLMNNLAGIWGLGWDYSFRLPLLAAFIAFSASFAFWPIRKNIGTLISCTAAVMVALQFWHGFGGGTYLAYYIPLAILIFLRPNVDGRDAVSEITWAENERRLKSETNADLLPAE